VSEPKTICPRCGVEFLQATADRTGGICMPCQQQQIRDEAFAVPFPIAQRIDSHEVTENRRHSVIMHTTAQQLLEESDQSEDRRYVLMMKKPLHGAILFRRVPELPNYMEEHVTRSLLNLFDRGEAEMEVAGVHYRQADLRKETWEHGVLYRDPQGEVVFRMQT